MEKAKQVVVQKGKQYAIGSEDVGDNVYTFVNVCMAPSNAMTKKSVSGLDNLIYNNYDKYL